MGSESEKGRVGSSRRKEQMQCSEIVKISDLNNREKEQEYVGKVRIAFDRIAHQEIGNVEEWKEFRDILVKAGNAF